MFKDTHDGQTHSYEDGCGHVRHNPNNKNCARREWLETKGFLQSPDAPCTCSIAKEKHKCCEHCKNEQAHAPHTLGCPPIAEEKHEKENTVDMSCPCGCGMNMTEKHYSCFHGQECGEVNCPTAPSDWELKLDNMTYGELHRRTAIKKLIRQQIAQAKEEGRREAKEKCSSILDVWMEDKVYDHNDTVNATITLFEDEINRLDTFKETWATTPLVRKHDLLAFADSLKKKV